MNWKCCKLKFSNQTFLIATDGNLLRVRSNGAIPEECRLEDCDSDNIQEINMTLDEIVLQRKQMTEV